MGYAFQGVDVFGEILIFYIDEDADRICSLMGRKR